MKIRSFAYKKNIAASYKLPIPVISVGNITMGGSGKTPLVIHLAELFKSKGFKPAVVSRGYRGKSKESVNIVSDGKTVLMDSISAGDEPVLIANTVSNLVVATGKKRIFPCQRIINDFGCNIIILDDGFQHLGVARDLDLVLFDTTFFAGNSRVFPGGDLREPVSALNRCHAFVFTGVTQANLERAEKCSLLLKSKFPEKCSFNIYSSYTNALRYTATPEGLVKETQNIRQLPKELLSFCGIANPERFKKSIQESATAISDFITYPDHHSYTEEDLAFLNKKAENMQAKGLLTTEKDITKLLHINGHRLPVFTLPLKITPDADFDRFIFDSIGLETKNTI